MTTFNNPFNYEDNFDPNFFNNPNISGYIKRHIANIQNQEGVPLPLRDDMSAVDRLVEQNNEASDRRVKVARLIIVLIKIEKELTTVQETLNKLKQHSLKYKQNQAMLPSIEEKLATVHELIIKIRKARLNLNFTFI